MRGIGVALLLVSLPAAAQTEGVAPPTPPAPAPAPVLGMIEQVTRAAGHVKEMRQALTFVLRKFEEARAAKDVVKLNCVTDKLTNIKGLLRISEQADIGLQEAVAKREEQKAEHEYSKVAIAHTKILQLRAEAEQCVGMLAFETGKTVVDMETPPDLPGTDPSLAPGGGARHPTNRPPPASPVN